MSEGKHLMSIFRNALMKCEGTKWCSSLGAQGKSSSLLQAERLFTDFGEVGLGSHVSP